jgi:hypothetical protein
MADIRIHHYSVDPTNRDELLARRTDLITAIRAKHPGLTDTRLIDLGNGTFTDTWRWASTAAMQAALADIAAFPEAGAAMSLTRDASSEDGDVVDER